MKKNLNDDLLGIKDSDIMYINLLTKDILEQIQKEHRKQDQYIDVLKCFTEEQVYNIKIEVSRKFLEQYLLNDSVNNQLKQNIKKICLINNDIELKALKMKENN